MSVSSKARVQARRTFAYRLFLAGQTAPEIKDILANNGYRIAIRTVWDDIAKMKQQALARLDPNELDQLHADALGRLVLLTESANAAALEDPTDPDLQKVASNSASDLLRHIERTKASLPEDPTAIPVDPTPLIAPASDQYRYGPPEKA